MIIEESSPFIPEKTQLNSIFLQQKNKRIIIHLFFGYFHSFLRILPLGGGEHGETKTI